MCPASSSPGTRNTPFVVKEAAANYSRAIKNGLMQATLTARRGKTVTLSNNREVVEFINCSYLGLDVHPRVIEASKCVGNEWGANFCCARSRFSIEPQRLLEEELSELYRGRVIVFPSTTTAHMSVMPLLASGMLASKNASRSVCLIYDQFAHSSMQYLRPVLSTEATVTTIPHNSLDALCERVTQARERDEIAVYVADGVYSMGGLSPVRELLLLAQELEFYLYIDDAHGMTVYGDRGEGFVLSHVDGDVPDRLIVPFSLSKGFGAYGGGLVMAGAWREQMIRSYGQSYAFSAAQPFQSVEACRAVVGLHRNGHVQVLQRALRDRIALFDSLMGPRAPFSPIRMIPIGSEDDAIVIAEELVTRGYFPGVVFFPIVRRGSAQLRLCIAANHAEEEIRGVIDAFYDAGIDVGQLAKTRP